MSSNQEKPSPTEQPEALTPEELDGIAGGGDLIYLAPISIASYTTSYSSSTLLTGGAAQSGTVGPKPGPGPAGR